jgi:WD40 repeat protein
LEAVSSRLKGELIHPNRTASPAALYFSPDGKRLLAGDYPGGVIAVWDLATGKRLTTIEAGYGYHATLHYYAVSPDWRTLFAWREKRKPERVEQDGKRMIRWTFDGAVCAWDLDNGKLLRTYKHQPPRNIRVMRLSPDGKTFYTFDELPGTYEGGPKNAVSLWDVKAGTYRTLEGVNTYGLFSPDGKTLAFAVVAGDGYSHGLKLIDAATGRDKWSVPVTDKYASAEPVAFSPDGKLLFGAVRVYERPKNWDNWRSQMKWWDAATGREIASFDTARDDTLFAPCFSPDGGTLAAFNWPSDQHRKLFLYDVSRKRLARTTPLCDKVEGQRSITSSPVFSPDGKWLAVITRTYPEKARGGEDLDPRDLPQPRILLIETATGAIRETLVAPQSFASTACFSPDGRTLATGGHGRVLLWDVADLREGSVRAPRH